MAKYSIGTKVVKADSESRGTIIEVMLLDEEDNYIE